MVRSHKPTKSSHAFDLLCCRRGIERWRRVVYKGILYPDYDVSNMGRMRHWYRPPKKDPSEATKARYARGGQRPYIGRYGKINKGSKGKGVYMRTILRMPGQTEKQHAKVHKLVAEAFIPNDENKPTVDHWNPDDANKTNNRLDNLRFATHKEQAVNQRPQTRESYDKKRRPVWKLDKTTGARLERYDSLAEACQAVGGKSPAAISDVCIGKYQTMYGFKWAFDDEDVNAREDETWKRIEPDVLDTKGAYECSTYGRVRCVKGGDKRIIDGADRQPRGDVRFSFYLKNGQRRPILNNVLTAKVFIPNPDNLPLVNHIDGKPWNCHVSNLEWITHKGNSVHAYANGLCKHAGWTSEEDRYILDLIAKYPERIPWSKLEEPPLERSMNAMNLRASDLRKRARESQDI